MCQVPLQFHITVCMPFSPILSTFSPLLFPVQAANTSCYGETKNYSASPCFLLPREKKMYLLSLILSTH